MRAERDGDQWVLNGQKIWTSAGHLADHIFTLARTDPDAPKHKGISFLLVDMRQPGIEVRPIKMLSGESEFNEVFYTDAVCPVDDVVGGVNDGWRVAMTLLGFERGEAAATVPIRFQAELDRLFALAHERGVAGDPLIRQRLAWCYSQVQVMRYSGMRVLTRFLAGHHPGPEAGISKLFWSEYHKVVTELAVDLLGAEAMTPSGRRPSSAFQTDDAGAPNSTNSWVDTFLNARAGTIYAGSSQIQRNIIGEMVLGLPEGAGAEVIVPGGVRTVGAIARRPGLWSTALRQARRLTPTGWWRTPPFLPVPAKDYRRLPNRHAVRRNRSIAESRGCGGLSRMVSGMGHDAGADEAGADERSSLNASYEPLSIVSSRRAVCLLLADKAELVECDEGVVRSATVSIPVPTVVRLRYMVRVPEARGRRRVPPSRVRP